MRDKLIEDMAGQGLRMDELARQLIALELAVPGISATALKMVVGNDAVRPSVSIENVLMPFS